VRCPECNIIDRFMRILKSSIRTLKMHWGCEYIGKGEAKNIARAKIIRLDLDGIENRHLSSVGRKKDRLLREA